MRPFYCVVKHLTCWHFFNWWRENLKQLVISENEEVEVQASKYYLSAIFRYHKRAKISDSLVHKYNQSFTFDFVDDIWASYDYQGFQVLEQKFLD